MPTINFSSMKSKWKKRDEKIKQETLKKKIKEEEKERLERERAEKAIALRKKNARIPHYGGVISTNKNIAMKKFLLRKMSTGTSTMSVTQMEAFEKLKRELGEDINLIEKEVKKSTRRESQFETIVHKVPVITTSDVVDLSNVDDDDEDKTTKKQIKRMVSLSSITSNSSNSFNKNNNKKRRGKGNSDSFLNKDLDELSGITKKKKNKNKNQKKNKKKIIVKKRKNNNNNNNSFKKKHNNNKKRKQQTNSNSNRFDQFLTMSLDDLNASKSSKRNTNNTKKKKKRRR